MKQATGSHTGTGVWLLQRATALMLALALPVLLGYVWAAWPLDFSGWKTLWVPVWCRVLMLMTTVSLALHAWVGMRDIFMDYVHPIGVRLALMLMVITLLSGSVVWLVAVLFGSPIWSGA